MISPDVLRYDTRQHFPLVEREMILAIRDFVTVYCELQCICSSSRYYYVFNYLFIFHASCCLSFLAVHVYQLVFRGNCTLV